MNKGILVGIAVLGGLLVFTGSAGAAQTPTPPPPAPPKPQPKKPVPTGPPSPATPPAVTAADVKFDTWFNYATGQYEPGLDFLTWYPGKPSSDSGAQAMPPPTPTPKPPAPPALPKAGEKWQFTFNLNRPLSFLEMSAAKSAFSSQIPDQHLDSAMQNATSTPPTVTISTTYSQDATSKSFPIGYTISKSGITATVSSARRVA